MMTTPAVSYADLYAEIKETDRRLAPGSETAMWGDFCARMHELGLDVHEPAEQTIDPDEAEFWTAAYSLFLSRPDCDDLQDIYNAI